MPQYATGLEPPISLLAPAYNEEATIAASVRSMLQLDYPLFEIIVINDGSKDNTLQVLRDEFGLVEFPQAYHVTLPVGRVRGVYRSPRYPNLRVVDKDNGGKADALNAGINAARHPLFCAMDADSILSTDSLRRIVRPFLEDASVIVSGGTVRIANGCRVSGGFLQSVGMPRSLLARVQIVEYLRAFLFGRLGWSPMNALLIVSGAFGVFSRRAVVEAGGYRVDTIGEDMELIVRLHLRHRLARRPYRIVFLPDPVCWTEAPESLRVLKSQRTRWQRGLLESLWANRALLFHRRGGTAGWLAFPVMLFFEALGPLIELVGYTLMLLGAALGAISWNAFVAFLVLAAGLGLLLSASALLLEEMSFRVYPDLRHLLQLSAALLIENLGYRQLTLWWRMTGILKWLVGRPAKWGDMRRSASWQAPKDRA
ncbi:MAG: glycosyltransferase [Burkholderiales bacterium]|nr:glycosyltransferase [Burkholderiales bacterium]MDE2299717.1 glycosyltransferase [Burkholderiales bacterium]